MPGPGRIINQGVLNSKTSRNWQELPLGEAAERSEAEEGRSRQLFHAHSAANSHNVPFRLGFQGLPVHPAALFCPGRPGHLPPREGLGGSFEADTIQLGIYRTALREREDNILPYGGVRSFGWNHSTGYAKMYLSPPQKRTGWARALAE